MEKSISILKFYPLNFQNKSKLFFPNSIIKKMEVKRCKRSFIFSQDNKDFVSNIYTLLKDFLEECLSQLFHIQKTILYIKDDFDDLSKFEISWTREDLDLLPKDEIIDYILRNINTDFYKNCLHEKMVTLEIEYLI